MSIETSAPAASAPEVPASLPSPPASPTRGGEFLYRVVLIGSAAVGKTNLLAVAARGQQFDKHSEATLQPEFVTGL
jgi:hypothetical protein